MTRTFEEIAGDVVGTVYEDWFDEGIRCIILRGPASLCGYLGIPIDHPLAHHDYDDIPVDVHGGLTYSHEGDDKHLPKGYWWYGWDYAHLGDTSFYELDERFNFPSLADDEHRWTVEQVKGEFWSVIYQLKKLMKLVEKS